MLPTFMKSRKKILKFKLELNSQTKCSNNFGRRDLRINVFFFNMINFIDYVI